MHYADLESLAPAKFKRLTGVSPDTFGEMLTVLRDSWRDFGRPCKLRREDQLLLALMYWREYRSLAHIAATYHVSEPTVSRTIHRVEDTLMASGKFTLPGKKAVQASDTLWQFVVIDTTETPIERPKKSNESTTAARKSVIASNRKS